MLCRPHYRPQSFWCRAPIGWVHYELMAAVCQSVRLSVRLSLCLSRAASREREGVESWKIGRKEDPWPHLEVERSNTCQGDNFGAAQLVRFTGTSMSNRRLAETYVWLIKSPLAGGGGIVWRPHYRPHSLLRGRQLPSKHYSIIRRTVIQSLSVNLVITTSDVSNSSTIP